MPVSELPEEFIAPALALRAPRHSTYRLHDNPERCAQTIEFYCAALDHHFTYDLDHADSVRIRSLPQCLELAVQDMDRIAQQAFFSGGETAQAHHEACRHVEQYLNHHIIGLAALARWSELLLNEFYETSFGRMAFGPSADSAREKANERARALLLRHLDPTQTRQFEANQSFECCAANARRYLIYPQLSYNVRDLASGERYCVQMTNGAPLYDQMLMQKLMLEHDCERFFKLANVIRQATPTIDHYPRYPMRLQF